MAFDDNSGEENENTVNKPAILKQLGQRLVGDVVAGLSGDQGAHQPPLAALDSRLQVSN